jgi:hypothetical protein
MNSPSQLSEQMTPSASSQPRAHQTAAAGSSFTQQSHAHYHQLQRGIPYASVWQPWHTQQSQPAMHLFQPQPPPPRSCQPLADDSLSSARSAQLLQCTASMRNVSLSASASNFNHTYGSQCTLAPPQLPMQIQPSMQNGFAPAQIRPAPYPSGSTNGHRHGSFSSPVLLVTLLHRFHSDDPAHADLIPHMRVSSPLLQRTCMQEGTVG